MLRLSYHLFTALSLLTKKNAVFSHRGKFVITAVVFHARLHRDVIGWSPRHFEHISCMWTTSRSNQIFEIQPTTMIKSTRCVAHDGRLAPSYLSMLRLRLVMELSQASSPLFISSSIYHHDSNHFPVVCRRQPHGAPKHHTSPPIHIVTKPPQDMYNQLCPYE